MNKKILLALLLLCAWSPVNVMTAAPHDNQEEKEDADGIPLLQRPSRACPPKPVRASNALADLQASNALDREIYVSVGREQHILNAITTEGAKIAALGVAPFLIPKKHEDTLPVSRFALAALCTGTYGFYKAQSHIKSPKKRSALAVACGVGGLGALAVTKGLDQDTEKAKLLYVLASMGLASSTLIVDPTLVKSPQKRFAVGVVAGLTGLASMAAGFTLAKDDTENKNAHLLALGGLTTTLGGAKYITSSCREWSRTPKRS